MYLVNGIELGLIINDLTSVLILTFSDSNVNDSLFCSYNCSLCLCKVEGEI